MKYDLAFVRIFVTDWDRAVAFYLRTLAIQPAVRIDDAGWMQLDTGTAQLAIERIDRADPESAGLVGRFAGVSLQVGDIADAHRRLTERGVAFLGPPEKQPWGGTLAHFRDPDGNVLTLLGSS